MLSSDVPTIAERQAALAAIGTNALPHLVTWMSTEQSALEKHLLKITVLDRFGFRKTRTEWQNREQRDRLRAHNGFLRFKEKAAPAAPELQRIFAGSRNPRGRMLAASSLGAIGPAASNAIPSLVEGLRDRDTHVRSAAMRALAAIAFDNEAGQFRPGAAEVMVRKLTKVLDNPGPHPLEMIQLCGDLGPPAKDTAPKLKPFLKSDNPRLRDAARDALLEIEEGIAPMGVESSTPHPSF